MLKKCMCWLVLGLFAIGTYSVVGAERNPDNRIFDNSIAILESGKGLLVNITGPSAGSNWYIDMSYSINWTITGGEPPYLTWLRYSTNGGCSWLDIPGAQDLDVANFMWTVPATPSLDAKVMAEVFDNQSQMATGESGTFAISPQPGGNPPDPPVNLTATPDYTYLTLSWKAPQSGAIPTGYNIRRDTSPGGPYELIANVTSTTYIDTGLTNGQIYYYVVTASNIHGESGYSDEANATPGTVVMNPVAYFTSPTPGEVWFSGGTYQINFTIIGGTAPYAYWMNCTVNGIIYVPISKAQGKSGVKGSNIFSWIVPSTPSQNCRLSVDVACGGGGHGGCESDKFEIAISPQALPAPANLGVSIGDKQVTLTWDAVSGADGYNVYRSETSGSGYSPVSVTTSLTYADTGLTNNKSYYYTVTAVKGNLESAMSQEASATPNAPNTGGKPKSTDLGLILMITALIVLGLAIALVAMRRTMKRKAMRAKKGDKTEEERIIPTTALKHGKCAACGKPYKKDAAIVVCRCGKKYDKRCADSLKVCQKCGRVISTETTVIDEVFLIYNDGRLIKHETRRLKPDMDQDILSSMLVAVQSFVKDAFRGEEGGLDEMKFGELKVLIGRGKWIIIAAVLVGEEIEPLRPQIVRGIDDIETDFKSVLAKWDGNHNVVEPIAKYLKDLINGKYK